MTVAEGVSPRFEIGRVASRTFGVIGRNLVVFLSLATLLAGVPQAIVGYFTLTAVFGSGGASAFLISGCAALIGFVAMGVLQAALIHGSVADLNGRKANLSDCLSTGLRFFLPVIGVSILTGLGIAVGFVLLIVPGVLLALAWCVNVPVVVVERKDVFAAFGRSADLTRNHRGAILVLVIAYALVAGILQQVTLAVTGGFSLATLGSFNATQWVVLTVLQVAESLIGAAGIAAIYYELRSIKEGIGPEALASVFD
jgi:hypothetical protein